MKEKFLKELELKLKVLDSKERSKVIKRYEKKIDDEIKSGKEEKEVFKNIGTVNKVTKEVFKEYKLSTDNLKEESSKESTDKITEFVDYVSDTIKQFVNSFDEMSAKNVIEIMLYVLVFIVIFSLFRGVFAIMHGFGFLTLGLFRTPFSNFLILTWGFLLNIAFWVLIVLIILALIKNASKTEKEAEKTTSKTKKKEEEKEVIESKEEPSKVLWEVFIILCKIVVVFLTIPLMFIALGLLIAIGVLIGLLIKGVMLIGPLLIIIGLFLLISNIIGLIFYAVFSKGGVNND